jgi:hypothetical protein
MLLMFFVLIILFMFGGTAFLVVIIDNVIVVTGIIVVSVIGSASAGIWPVSVVSAVAVIALIAVVFLGWPTPAIAGEKGMHPVISAVMKAMRTIFLISTYRTFSEVC